MGSNLVIVAIPADDDYVWKLSSEKVPHLTLLFLGDVEQEGERIQRISDFLDHAVNVSNMGPFYLDVDRRGKLGEDEADVLFFDKGWSSEEIEQLRGWLLQNHDIKTLFDAAPQFEGWVPHLTMGYPDSPAKEDPRDYPGIGHVRFDRLALWIEDYDGPEYRLKRRNPEHGAVAWSDEHEAQLQHIIESEEGILEHYGVKGMRWGVRRQDTSGGGSSGGEKAKSALKTIGKGIGGAVKLGGDIQFENMANDGRARSIITREAGDALRRTDLPKIKAKPEYAKAAKRTQRMLHPRDPVVRQYRKDAREAYIKRLEESANNHTNFSGNRQWTIRERGWELPAQGGKLPTSKYFWDVSTREVKHAVDTSKFTRMEVILDEDGFIVDLQESTEEAPEQSTLAQAMELFEDDTVIHTADLGFAAVQLQLQHSDDAMIDFVAAGGLLDDIQHEADPDDEDSLEHYGVKGMRWGVRKAPEKLSAQPGTSAVTKRVIGDYNQMGPREFRGKYQVSKKTYAKRVEKHGDPYMNSPAARVGKALNRRAARKLDAENADKKERGAAGNRRFKRQVKSASVYLKLHDNAVERGKAGRKAIDNKPEYKNAKFGPFGKDRRTPLHKKYVDEHYQLYVKNFNAAANAVKNKEGTQQYAFRDKPDAKWWQNKRELYIQDVKHADDEVAFMIVELLVDEDGKVTGYKMTPPEDTTMAQSEVFDEAALQHYGVKGMRWGHRKQQVSTTAARGKALVESKIKEAKTPSDVRVSGGANVLGRTVLRTAGGKAQPPADDAIKVAVARQKMKRSGVQALSNKELEAIANRANLEERIRNMDKKRPKTIEEQLLDDAVDVGVSGAKVGRQFVKRKLTTR